MGTASAAREPSMEEILASIRRIIEDSDGGRKRPDDNTPTQADNDSDIPEASVVAVEAFRAELRKPALELAAQRQVPNVQVPSVQVPGQAPSRALDQAPNQALGQAHGQATHRAPDVEIAPQRQAPMAEQRKRVTLAEVQARMAADPVIPAKWEPAPAPASVDRAESVAQMARRLADLPFGSGRTQQEPEAKAKEPAHVPEPARVEIRPEPAAKEAKAEIPRDQDFHAAIAKMPELRQSAPAIPAVERKAAPISSAFVAPEASAPAMEARHEPDLHLAARAIISHQAGRQVAASFGELSEAFSQRSRKTFDEVAEEMMRPMLQDWMDNNLPTLVERLVREEIERVARGTQ